MSYLAFFLFLSLLSTIPGFLHLLLGVEIGNVTTIGTIIFLGLTFLYSFLKGFKNKKSYLIFSAVYWIITLSFSACTYFLEYNILFHISSMLNILPLAILSINNNMYLSLLFILGVQAIVIGLSYSIGYYLNSSLASNKPKKRLSKA